MCRWLLIAVLLFAGCSLEEDFPEANSPDLQQASGRFVWDREGRPYSVMNLEEKNVPAIGVQHRRLQVVIPDPMMQEDVEAIAEEVYNELKADIEKTQPDAEHKRINILVYDSPADAEDYLQILQVENASWAEPTIAEWRNAEFHWTWRLPDYRPPIDQRELYTEYWRGLDVCQKQADAPYYDENGILSADPNDAAAIERQKLILKRELVRRLMEKHDVSGSALASKLAYVFVWKNGDEPTDAAVSHVAKSFIEEWSFENGK